MVLSHLHDIPRELVSHDGRVLRHVVVNPLVILTQDGALVCRHTDAVRNHLHQNLVISDLRKLKLLQSQIICSVQSHAFCFHNKYSFLIINLILINYKR